MHLIGHSSVGSTNHVADLLFLPINLLRGLPSCSPVFRSFLLLSAPLSFLGLSLTLALLLYPSIPFFLSWSGFLKLLLLSILEPFNKPHILLHQVCVCVCVLVFVRVCVFVYILACVLNAHVHVWYI